MFSGHAALTMETMRERRVAAEQRQRQLDADEVRALDVAASARPVAMPAARTPATSPPRLTLVEW
jgi:hypothetical protein